MLDAERLERHLLGLILRLPAALRSRTTESPFSYEGQVVEPDTRFLLHLGKLKGKSFPDMSIARARRHYQDLCTFTEGPALKLLSVTNKRVMTPWGALPMRHYANEGFSNAILFFHGGGFAIGDLDTHDTLCRRIAAETDCLVISVDYRLGPEAPFPAAVDDAWHAYQWLVDNADSLGASGKLVVAGDSAGGNLAATVCWMARDEGIRCPDLQVCIYPAVASVDHPGRQREGLQQNFGLDARTMEWFINHYLEGSGATEDDPRLSPLYIRNHASLPEAIVSTAHFDLLSSEGDDYAKKLKKEGIVVHHLQESSLIHGYATMSAFPVALAAIQRITAQIRKSLAD